MSLSFSGKVKKQLCSQAVVHSCCARAEAYGVLLYCNTFTSRGIRIITESASFKARLPQIFHRAFKVEFDELPTQANGKGSFLIQDRGKLKHIFDAFDYEVDCAVTLHVNFAMLEEEHCRVSFFRGAFLAGGSVTDPGKGYHLELVTSHGNVSREVTALMREEDIHPKSAARGGNHILYFKQSEHIEDFLTLIGAPLAAMEVMNAKLEKNLRGSVNRRVNCDAANLDKSVAAAQEQIELLRKLEKQRGLVDLPDKLRQAADLRMDNPELTLAQLAEMCDPPVTKSCYNHRLRKLMELARNG